MPTILLKDIPKKITRITWERVSTNKFEFVVYERKVICQKLLLNGVYACYGIRELTKIKKTPSFLANSINIESLYLGLSTVFTKARMRTNRSKVS